jgi:hypothetical protein
MVCPLCGDRSAEAKYYRLNPVTEEIQHLCQPCWVGVRKTETEWEYFKGAGKLLLYYTILPVIGTAVLVWIVIEMLF